jgi:hypothetical protein
MRRAARCRSVFARHDLPHQVFEVLRRFLVQRGGIGFERQAAARNAISSSVIMVKLAARFFRTGRLLTPSMPVSGCEMSRTQR